MSDTVFKGDHGCAWKDVVSLVMHASAALCNGYCKNGLHVLPFAESLGEPMWGTSNPPSTTLGMCASLVCMYGVFTYWRRAKAGIS